MSSNSKSAEVIGPTGYHGPEESIKTNPSQGPQGSSQVDVIKLLDMGIYGLLGTVESILKMYIDKMEILQVTFDSLKLKLDTDVDLSVVHEQFALYKKLYVMSTPQQKEELHLILFDKILKEKPGVLLQSINNDSWIKNNIIKIMLGDHKGASSRLCLHLGQFYRYSLAIEQHHRNKMKEYPELYKEGPEILYPHRLLYYCFSIFKLTESAKEENRNKAISTIIHNFERKLGIQAQNPLAAMSGIMDSIMPVGVDLLNKHQAAQGGAKIQPDQLKNVVNKLFSNGKFQTMLNGFQNSARNGSQPDIGSVVGNILQSVNPSEMFKDLQEAVTSEIPQIVPDSMKGPQGQKEPEGPKNPESQEEVIEEVVEEEIIEEIVED